MKVGFEKTYDSFNWNYMYTIMVNMCLDLYNGIWGMFVCSCSLSALINGRPMVWKRLRQEDLLSQFLYLINVVEGLIGMI